MTHTLPEQVKAIGDVASISIIGGTLAGILPALAAAVSIIWGAIRIYDTRTFQKALGRRTMTRKDYG